MQSNLKIQNFLRDISIKKRIEKKKQKKAEEAEENEDDEEEENKEEQIFCYKQSHQNNKNLMSK